jgi:DNA-binding CsgD family transcriptional regulator
VGENGVSGVRTGRGRLLERERELASLDALIAEAAAGEGHVGLVEGPAGIGKTRLVAEAKSRAADAGLRVLTARGGELEREFAFGVVHQLFGPALADEEVRAATLTGAAAAARSVFAAVEDGEGSGGDASFAVLHGLYWLTVNLSAEQPLLLAIDDLHWCDHPSLRFLAYLVRRLEGLPVLVVTGLRPSEPGVDTALLGEIAADPLTVTVHPGALSEEAVAELVRDRLGADAEDTFVAACHSSTEGNPLLLNELLKALAAEGVQPTAANIATVRDLGPRAASRAVLLRLARLPSDAVSVARAVAVLGDDADLAHVAALTGLDETDAARATRELVQAEMLRPELPLGFVHPLVGAAVYRDVSPGERELQHGRAARLLADLGASEEQVAAHVLAMPHQGDPWVVDTLRHAARVASGRGASESAVAYLRRALEEPPEPGRRAEVLLELGIAEAFVDGIASAEHLLAGYAETTDPVVRAEVAVALVSPLMFTGRAAEASAIALDAMAPLGPEHDDLRRWIEANRITIPHFDLTAGSLDSAEYEPYRGELAGPDVGARALAAAASYQWAMTGGSAEDCVAVAHRALGDGKLISGTHAGGPTMGAVIVLALADQPDALTYCDEVLVEAHRHGSLFEASGGYLFRGFSHLLRGSLSEAERDLKLAMELTETWGSTAVLLYPASFLAQTLTSRGDLDGARAALARASLPADPPPTTNVAWWYAGRLWLHLAAGEWQEVLDVADEVERRLGGVIVNPGWVPWRTLRAEALLKLGRADDAVENARAELELARRWGAPRSLGRALRVLGTASGPDGLELLEDAVAVLEGSIARLEYARSLAALGTALRHARRPSDAREPLRVALDIATSCEAAPLAEHVRAELYAAGARPRATALSGVEALTASESRVAGLAAEGQTNRDIAQALYVTPKTVEVHLSNVYRKLGISSRRQLSAALTA